MAITAFDYLRGKHEAAPPAVCVLFGDDAFFKRLVLGELRHRVLGEGEADFSLSTFAGDEVEPRDVFDELSTIALFGSGRKLVVVDDADDFVSRHRSTIEDYVARPKSSGVLVMVVKSWAANTRLYKAIESSGLQIDCNAPAEAPLAKWLVHWAKTCYRAKLTTDAADMLVEIVGAEPGLLDQELAKLSAAAGADGEISAERVQQLVGGWRVHTTWDMLDSALAGNAPSALEQLDRLLLSGEEPIGVLAQISSNLRRFAAATRLIEQQEAEGRRPNLRAALEGAGFRPAPFIMDKAEKQLKSLGRQRGSRLYRWLLDADLALKGQSSQKLRARLVLEQLIARLSTAADPRNAKHPALHKSEAHR
jgi:DNA polymerase-3 subunit delta